MWWLVIILSRTACNMKRFWFRIHELQLHACYLLVIWPWMYNISAILMTNRANIILTQGFTKVKKQLGLLNWLSMNWLSYIMRCFILSLVPFVPKSIFSNNNTGTAVLFFCNYLVYTWCIFSYPFTFCLFKRMSITELLISWKKKILNY